MLVHQPETPVVQRDGQKGWSIEESCAIQVPHELSKGSVPRVFVPRPAR